MPKLSVHDDIIPFFCPVCDFSIDTSNDINDFLLFSCCHECNLQWIESKRFSSIDEIDKNTDAFSDYLLLREQQFKARLELVLSQVE